MSKVLICNMALGYIGQAPVASITEDTPTAKICKQYYDAALHEVLRDHPWNFAQSRRRLALMDTPEEWAREYSLAYAYPDQCVRLQYIVTAQGEKSRVWTVANVEGRRAILTDMPKAIAAFTRFVDDATLYDGMFRQCFARKLQSKIVAPILKSGPERVKEAETLYAQELDNARLADAREGRQLRDDRYFWDAGQDPWVTAGVGQTGSDHAAIKRLPWV